MALTFDMNSPADCLEDFRRKVEKFDKDDLNTSLAMDCALAGWTVIDWLFKAEGQRLGYAKLPDFQAYIREKNPSLGYLQDIANARKHKDITYYTPTVQDTGLHGGAFSRGFSRGFDISRLIFKTDQNQTLTIYETLVSTLKFLDEYFEANQIIAGDQ